MVDHLKEFVLKCELLTMEDYYQLVKGYGSNIVNAMIDSYVYQNLEKDFSYEAQKKLWDRFGVYFSILDHSVFEKYAIDHLKKSGEVKDKNRGGLSLEEEKMYGYHLLSRPYIQICSDKNRNQVNMEKVFASIRSIEVRDFILGQFQKLYSHLSRVSNADKKMQYFLQQYQQLCEEVAIPNIFYDGELLSEDILMDQVKMYVRYSIARDKFLLGNLGLIHSIAKKYQCANAEYEDLYQVGYLGLLRAVDGYDVRCDILFSTYATNGIRNYIRRYLRDYSRMVRFPAEVENLNYRIEKQKNLFQLQFDRNPTEEELAKLLGVSLKKVHYALSIFYQCNCTSLDIPIDDDTDNKTLGDKVVGEKDIMTEQVISRVLGKYILQVIEKNLNQREQMILFARADGMTLKELGLELKVTPKRIEQIQRNAILKLRKVPGFMSANPFRE